LEVISEKDIEGGAIKLAEMKDLRPE